MTDLLTLLPPGAGVTNLNVEGINDRGQIVGASVESSGREHALLLTPSDGGTGDVRNNVAAIAGPPRPEDTSLAISAALGASLDAGRASGGSAQVLLPATLTNATLTANQVIHVAGSSGADRSDGLSSISTGPTWDVATVPSALPGSGDSAGGGVHSVAAAGADTGLTSNDVFARSDEVFRVDL
jgi:probable HAF family extracellular repeat protein